MANNGKAKILIEQQPDQSWSIVARTCTERGFSSQAAHIIADGFKDAKEARQSLDALRKGKVFTLTA